MCSTFRYSKIGAAVMAGLLAASGAHADDGSNGNPGSPFMKSMSQKLAPNGEAAHAFVDAMNRYVPAQAADGSSTSVEHHNVDGDLVETVNEAKPQIGVFLHGPVEHVETDEEIGFTGHGKRDAYAAVSLDDGNTWKVTNLSESADQSSIDLGRTDIELYAGDDVDGYPGDVINIAQATAGDRTMVAWFSRYCGSGQPNYSLEDGDPDRRDAIAEHMGIDLSSPSHDDLYLTDMFRVAGQQQSVDYGQDPFEKNHPVGEVPYACLWAARGTLEAGDDPATEATESYHVAWRKAERLTSGRRDVNRVEMDMVEGAGAVITWQEDPEGLRPGQGLGPGAGWSGAVAHHETDVWYSFIDWDDFDKVQQEDDQGEPTGDIVALENYAGTSNRPKVGVPMAMPMRMTDNTKCNVNNPAPYCNGSAINADGISDDVRNPLDYGMKDMCADTVEIETGQNNTLADVCVTEEGLPLIGNTSSTRPRLDLFGYDSNSDGEADSAWMVFQVEESKGLGKFGFDDGGSLCDPETDENCEQFDVGKNIWYHTFSMSLFDSRATADNGLVANLTNHGNMLNQPAQDWETGDFYPITNTSELWDFRNDTEDYNFDIYQTEIARRGSLLAQEAAKAEPEGLVAFPAWKQGIMQQGGPADVMARRILLPDSYTEGVDNPYAFTNMACDNWVYTDGSNPYYPDGLCLDAAINLSSVTPDTCVDNQDDSTQDCPTVDPTTGTGDTNPILQGSDIPEPNTTKVLTWHQCPNDAALVSSSDAITPVTACEDTTTNRADNITDQSWHNPLDVAKGHRGFVDGDFIMILYAWSPNWKLNTRGRDRYELYVRRSFDGGETWTTLPASFTASTGGNFGGNGTVDCETFRTAETQTGGGGDTDEPQACFGYYAGDAQPARNVSQLKSMRFTILDPRYSETAPTIEGSTADEDQRDPSRYFIVYETGDNRTVEFGEAESLNLFYSRGVQFGDHYQVWAEADNLSECYPSEPLGDADVSTVVEGSGFCNEFDALEGKQDIASGEGSIEGNPGGEWLYAVWSQEDESSGEFDAMWRRVWYIDDYDSEVSIPSNINDDVDGDNVLTQVENGVPNPDGTSTGDGNGDGEPDSTQSNVASTETVTGDDYVTIANGTVESGYRLSHVSVESAPADAPAGLAFPHGLFHFTLNDVPAHGTVEVSVYVPYNREIFDYFKKDVATGQWQPMDATVEHIGTSKTKLTFTLTNGGAFDADGDADNDSIQDPGGPVVLRGIPGDDAPKIPTMNQWALGLLTLMLAVLALGALPSKHRPGRR